jgi:uncharacterized protein (TIGR00369 family)
VGVSTELTISFGAPFAADGSLLWAAGEGVHHDAHAALAVGSVKTTDGRTIATGTQRTRFLSGAPVARPSPAAVCGHLEERDLVALLGLESNRAGAFVFAASEAVANPAGNIHGGILFCVSELAAAHAAAAAAGLGAESIAVHYLRPGHIGETLRCETEVAHRGRTAATAVVRCRRRDGKTCALATVHYGPVDASNR